MTPEARLGYWFEVLLRGPSSNEPPEAVALEMLSDPHRAIRTIRIQVRSFHVLGMSPREITRAVDWTDDGWVQALAALHRGEPCGFSILLSSGKRAEWRVRPTPYVLLSDSHSRTRHPCCPDPELSK